MNDKGVVYIGTKSDQLQTVLFSSSFHIQSFNMTELHEYIQTFCNDYSLKYPQLVSLKGDKALSREQGEELKKRLFDMGVNPLRFVRVSD